MISFVLMTALTLSPIPTGIVITEVQIRSESRITIFNPGTEDLDVSGFRLRRRSSTGREYSVRVFPRGSIIIAGGYFTWSNSKDDRHLDIGADVWSTALLSNNNSIALVSPKGDIIDSVAWGSGKNQFLSGEPIPLNPSEGQIIRRIFSDEGYRSTGDNSDDFELYPGIKLDVPRDTHIRTWTKERNDGTSPIAIGSGIAILSALSILMLKRAIF